MSIQEAIKEMRRANEALARLVAALEFVQREQRRCIEELRRARLKLEVAREQV